ncbi:MAG: elongation factor 4, partial [Caldisericia bacterium]|nr:elongation factor 4 [Caldisericia bacterium]
MLHMEIFLERARREFDQELIATMPSVVYKITKTNGDVLTIDNPSKFPTIQQIDHIEEPIVTTRIMVPSEYVGSCMELANSKRGSLVEMEYPDTKRTILVYDLPLAEMIIDFYDKLKTVSRGYASLDYDFKGFKRGDLVKVDILVNSEQVDALSYISEKDSAISKARRLVHSLLKLIPRQQFKVPLQGAINGKIIAREDIAAVRKDVLAKCYGGDITRKKKLLEKQKKGKKRMKMIGSVEVPQEAFLSLLNIQRDDKKK